MSQSLTTEEENAEDSDVEESRKHSARATAEDEDDEDDFDVAGPGVIANVVLAKTIGTSMLCYSTNLFTH